MPYSVDGDFGRVRLISHLPTQAARNALSYTTSAGWHRCNEKYRIGVNAGACDSWLLFFTVGGCGHFRLDGNLTELTGNTVAVMPPFTPCEYNVPPGGLWEFYWIHVDGTAVSAMLQHITASFGNVFPIGAALAGMASSVEELLFLKGTGSPCFEARASRIISAMLHDILLELTDRERAGAKERDAVREMIRLLETNYAGKVSIDRASRSLYVNPAHMTRLFRARTGFTPYEYLLRYRIIKSKELLLYTDKSVKEIAAQTGFAQVSNFISRFRAQESVTPAEFRRRTGGEGSKVNEQNS